VTIGRKQSIHDDARWAAAWATARTEWPDDRLDGLLATTAEEMHARLRGLRVGVAYGGGKDAIALVAALRWAGITPDVGVFGAAVALSYRSMLRFVARHAPPYVVTVDPVGWDLAWLRDHPGMLFPRMAGDAGDAQNLTAIARWSNIHNRAQDVAFRRHRLDIMLTGRRVSDGNWTGPGHDYVTASTGTRRYSPLAEWTHEAVFALIQRDDMALPESYAAPGGFYRGSAVPWPRVGPWSYVYEAEPDIVREAADARVPGAADFLRTV
jgi:3'-phosphoadenosine 5'-phosphosulfate sulfotransferase (PAPS reductase)/FAD synthetase